MGIRIRPLEGQDELERAVALQEATWGSGFSERVPASLLKVAARLGGVVSGAFDDEGELVGFVFGLTGLEGKTPVHWSDMLAVSPTIRDGGLGRRLKLHQRERVLALGVETMRWTFDPLESRNGWLNLTRLGAVCAEYVVDMYGVSDSPLHQGLGTDRFVARWDLRSRRVLDRVARLEGGPDEVLGSGGAGGGDVHEAGPLDAVPAAFGVRAEAAGLAPVGDARAPSAPVWRVPIPSDTQALKAADPDLAVAWRTATRAVLGPALGRGAEVRELVRGGAVSWYLVFERDA